ncbi:MAG: hypothetical protein K1X67_20940 [Fimbriimonadaceae bacterium]|nr:hypothetical protein [Fimbriimonadaceae bacterium]
MARKIPSIYSVSMADCFAGVVAAILVCAFLQQVVATRQRAELLDKNNVILQVTAVGIGPAEVGEPRKEYPVPITLHLWIPDRGGGISRNGLKTTLGLEQEIPLGRLEVIPPNLRRYRLSGIGGGPPRDFAASALWSTEIRADTSATFRGVDGRLYPRFLLVVEVDQVPAEPIEEIQFHGQLIDPANGFRRLSQVASDTNDPGVLKEWRLSVEKNHVTIDVTQTLGKARLLLRAEVTSQRK